MSQLAVALAIYLVVPVLGVAAYLFLCLRMRLEQIPRPPFGQLIILFATYGGVLLVILTSAFGGWSGMASLGTFYLLLGAPFVLFFLAAQLRPLRLLSRYHCVAFYASAAYVGVWLMSVVFYFLYLVRWAGAE